jgi:hypothetical protein
MQGLAEAHATIDLVLGIIRAPSAHLDVLDEHTLENALSGAADRISDAMTAIGRMDWRVARPMPANAREASNAAVAALAEGGSRS